MTDHSRYNVISRIGLRDHVWQDLTGEVGFEAFRRWRKLKMDSEYTAPPTV